MKMLGCIVSSGLLLAAWSANAQVPGSDGAGQPAPRQVSDFETPYWGAPPPAPPAYAPPVYSPPPGPPAAYAPAPPAYAPPALDYAPALIPPHEVYAVLRDNGFLPLGIPHRLGPIYEIAAMGPSGQGRLQIDGRTGRIIRFRPGPAYGGGPGIYEDGPGDDSYSSEPYDLNDSSDANNRQRPPAAVRGGPPSRLAHADRAAVPRPAKSAGAQPSEKPRQRAQKPANAPVQVQARAAGAQPSEKARRSAQKPANAPAQVQARAAATAPVTTDKAGETKIAAPLIKPTEVAPPVQGLE